MTMNIKFINDGWPLKWYGVVTNWRGHPRYIFTRHFAYTRSSCGEVDGYDEGADVRHFRYRKWEFTWARPQSSWTQRWDRFFAEKAWKPES